MSAKLALLGLLKLKVAWNKAMFVGVTAEENKFAFLTGGGRGGGEFTGGKVVTLLLVLQVRNAQQF